MLEIEQVKGEARLAEFLYQEIPELYEYRNQNRLVKAAFVLRDWTTSISCYSRAELLLDHNRLGLVPLLRALLQFKGGIWCGGAAMLFKGLLNAIKIPAATLSYGFSESLSHLTVVFGYRTAKRQQFSVLDSYLGFHFVDAKSDELLDLVEVLRRIRDRRHNTVKRVDREIPRPFVTDTEDRSRAWLFSDGRLPEVSEVLKDRRVYQGAIYTLPKLLLPTTGFRRELEKSKERKDNRSLNTYMLDMMLVNPVLSRLNSECEKCYLDWQISQRLLKMAFERGLHSVR